MKINSYLIICMYNRYVIASYMACTIGTQSPTCNAVKYVFSANTVLILIQYFLAQISVLKLTEFFIARN